MKFYSRKLIKPGDLNAHNTLFGGALLRWIDEEAGIYAMNRLNTPNVVTKYMSEIDFISTARQGDIVEIGIEFLSIGRTSITFRCVARNLFTKKNIISIDKIVFVRVDKEGIPTPHHISSKDIQNQTWQ